MNPVVQHIVSGHAFFTGIVLIIIAAAASMGSRPMLRRVTVFAFVFGVLAVVLSSTAISYWYYGIAAVVTLAWIASRFKKSWRTKTAYATIAVWLLLAAVEVPNHITPVLGPTTGRSIAVIGDSVTAGVGGDETSERWPNIIAREHNLEVQDISHMGETAASALKRAQTHEITAALVVVEIGGNDVLGSTTVAEFATDLENLLAHLKSDGRQIVMFELPLPPLFHEYGRIQRSMAAKYDVRLVPKRVFLSVIAGGGATLDSIHLSQSGHQAMADVVWRLIQSAFAAQSG